MANVHCDSLPLSAAVVRNPHSLTVKHHVQIIICNCHVAYKLNYNPLYSIQKEDGYTKIKLLKTKKNSSFVYRKNKAKTSPSEAFNYAVNLV